jgi:hypothetical protein
LGTAYRNAKLVAIMDFEAAVTIENVDVLHRSVYPIISKGALVSENPQELVYYLFKLVNGTRKIFAKEWLMERSIIQVSERVINIRAVVNNSEQIKEIREAFFNLGIRDYTLTEV